MAKSERYQALSIHTPSSHYPVFIGHDLMDMAGPFVRDQVLIVSNKTVAPKYLQNLSEIFSQNCDVVILEDGEAYKNHASLLQIYTKLVEKKHHRDTTLLALGGGVICDIAGFAASTYQRGVDSVLIPTTLLAQVDAAIGGKTAVNYQDAKNMIGTFYQPKAVIMDLETLRTLPAREFRAGIAEIIKYAILVGGDFLRLIYDTLEAGNLTADSDKLAEIIRQCCLIKASFVEKDERESGDRALLNLGHTLAHALEAYTHYARWLHGEAVAIGLFVAALLSYTYYGLKEKDLILIDTLLDKAHLPRRIPKDIDLCALRAIMNHDKKIKKNNLRYVIIKALGECAILETLPEAELWTVLQKAIE